MRKSWIVAGLLAVAGSIAAVSLYVARAVTPAIARQTHLVVLPDEPLRNPLDVERSRVAAGDRTGSNQMGAALASAMSTSELSGTFRALASDGSELAIEHASFHLLLGRGSWNEQVPVEVSAGTWRATIPPGLAPLPEYLRVQHVWINGSFGVVVEPLKPLRLNRADAIEIVARVPHPTLLHVRDETSHQELSNVAVATSAWDMEGEHPGPDDARTVLGSGLSSPVAVDELLGNRDRTFELRQLYVQSPGYAWRSVRIDYDSGGERELLLRPGGDLEVNLAGVVDSPLAYLHVRRDGQIEDVSRASLRGGHVRFDSLSPGAFEVVATVGEPWEYDSVVLGRANATVRARETSSIDLKLDPVPQVQNVRAAGQFLLPLAWDAKPRCFGFTLDLLDAPRDGRQRTRVLYGTTSGEPVNGCWVYTWSADDLQPGQYKVEVSEPPFKAKLVVPEGGRSDARFQIGVPSDVTVRVVWSATGEDAAIDALNWTPVQDGIRHGTMQSAEYDQATHRYRIRCPLGRIQVSPSDPEVAFTNKEIDVGPERIEVTISVERATGLRLTLLDGETPVPFPPYCTPKFEGESGSVDQRGMRVDQASRIFYFDKGNRLTVSVGDIAGFEPPPEIVADVTGGTITPMAIALVRKR